MKTPQLRTPLFLQATIFFCVPVYFILWEQGIYLGVWGMVLILAGNLTQQYFERKCKEQLDECAKQTLLTVESQCFELAAAALVLVAGWLILIDTHKNVGLVISFVVFGLYLIRALLFAYWDKKGMV